MNDIFDSYVDSWLAEANTLSKPCSGKFIFRMKPSLHTQLKVAAAEAGVTLTELATHFIKTGLSVKKRLKNL